MGAIALTSAEAAPVYAVGAAVEQAAWQAPSARRAGAKGWVNRVIVMENLPGPQRPSHLLHRVHSPGLLHCSHRAGRSDLCLPCQLIHVADCDC